MIAQRSCRGFSRRLLLIAALLAAAALPGQSRADGFDDARECAEIIRQGGDMESAVSLCSRAIASRQIKGKALAPVYYNRGWAQDELGDYEAAIEDYGRALHIQPDFSDAYVARGYSYGRTGDRESAIADYSRAIDVNPDAFEARFNRGLAYEAKGDLERAVEDYDRAYELNPEHPRLRAIMKRLLRTE